MIFASRAWQSLRGGAPGRSGEGMSESLWDSGLSGLNRSCGFCMGSRSRRASKILEGQGLGHWSMLLLFQCGGWCLRRSAVLGWSMSTPPTW